MRTAPDARRRPRRVFVDESKERDYLLVAARVDDRDVDVARSDVRRLVLRGQRRLHMAKESDPRRRLIADAVGGMPISATVYNAGRKRPELDARAACLQALVADAAAGGVSVLVLEQDDSLRRWDAQQMVALTRAAGCRDSLRYRHERAVGEQLLALPDAIAWCWAKGGHWRRRVETVVGSVREV